MAFSHLPGGIGHFADSNSIPWSQTTTIHPVLTVAILLTYLPLLVGRLSQRCHLSRIDEVLKRGDSMINLHMLSQIPSSCLCIQLSLLATVPRTLNIFFCLIESIEWQDLVPRQRTCDCLWSHLPHRGLCDPTLSSHQTFLRELELRQCVFCKRPLLFWFSSRRRNFGLSGSEKNLCFVDFVTPFVGCSECES